ncbi:MAG: MerR family transcriptional regulator [Spirochaetia bacterium]|nr:MerR family transcriptional regulator [Spirochaetia bacterium]
MELTREELLQRLRLTPRELEEWTENELLFPVSGRGDLFPESAVEEGELIKKFCSLGYALPEIQKIKRSVGLPVKDDKGRYTSRSDFLTIGELAEKSGINVRTIKFWEEKGLIAPHRRTEGGFRLYRPGEVVLLTFIKDLQAFNYTLAEIGNILRLAGPDLGATDADLADMPLAEIEKTGAALEFLVERMREVRDASSRVETVFARRLRVVSRILRIKKRT